MANIRPKTNKDGEIISYQIRVYRGRDTNGKQLNPYIMSWKPPKDKSDKWIAKELEKQAALFEERCKSGNVCSSKQKFQDYANYVVTQKERAGAKATTIISHKEKLPRINRSFGFLNLADIKPQHINAFYAELASEGARDKPTKAVLKIDLKEYLKEKGITQNSICKATKLSDSTVRDIIHKKCVCIDTAHRLADYLGEDIKKLFDVVTDTRPLSDNTILDYHRTISMIFGFAVKEQILSVNPAKLATPPKAEEREANYFQPDELTRIVEELEKEPLKWRVIIHLMLVTGARRAEILGLKWSAIDFDTRTIRIENVILYTNEKGIYQDTPKTKKSRRKLVVTQETIELLKEYKLWYDTEKERFGNVWHDTDLLFYQTKPDKLGLPLHPSTINQHLMEFSERANIGHINPHAFRHSLASLLINNNVDIVEVSHRLGHAKVGTTLNIYSHIIERADEEAAECIANIALRKNSPT